MSHVDVGEHQWANTLAKLAGAAVDHAARWQVAFKCYAVLRRVVDVQEHHRLLQRLLELGVVVVTHGRRPRRSFLNRPTGRLEWFSGRSPGRWPCFLTNCASDAS